MVEKAHLQNSKKLCVFRTFSDFHYPVTLGQTNLKGQIGVRIYKKEEITVWEGKVKNYAK